MSVDFLIFKVDPKHYKDWLETFDPNALEEDQYDVALEKKATFAEDVTERLYPPELHNTAAQVADEIVRALKKGVPIKVDKPASSLLGKLLGQKDTVTEFRPVADSSLAGFTTFAQVIYWSQTDGKMPNELKVKGDQLELTLGTSSLQTLAQTLAVLDTAKLEAFCRDSHVALNDLPVDGGLPAWIATWRKIVEECLSEGRGLAIETYG